MAIDIVTTLMNALIIEDIDIQLKDRSDGNTAMFRLLASSDGLLSNISKKIIISTNAASEANLDSALIRPGRCFSLVKMRSLTKDEVNKLVTKMGCDDLEYTGSNNLTVAQIYKSVKFHDYNVCNNDIKKLGF